MGGDLHGLLGRVRQGGASLRNNKILIFIAKPFSLVAKMINGLLLI